MTAHTPSWITVDRFLWVLSLLFAWAISRYFYRRSDKKRIPTFVLQSTKVLLDPELAHISGVSSVCNKIDLAGSGVVKATIYFWNSGTLPILRDQILEPYTITFPGPILHDFVTKLSRRVTELVSMPLFDPPNVVTLEFAILEPGDGGTIEVVYAGPVKAIEFKGACLESPRPMILSPDPIYSLPVLKRITGAYRGLFSFMVAAAAVIFVVGGLNWFREHYGQQVQELSLFGDLLLILVGLFVLSISGVALWAHIQRLASPYLPPDIKE
jgi:hypothetical protein